VHPDHSGILDRNKILSPEFPAAYFLSNLQCTDNPPDPAAGAGKFPQCLSAWLSHYREDVFHMLNHSGQDGDFEPRRLRWVSYRKWLVFMLPVGLDTEAEQSPPPTRPAITSSTFDTSRDVELNPSRISPA
jgi:hypothetical protein